KVDINDYGMTETLVEYGTDVTKNQFFNNYQQANPTLQTFFDHGAIVKIPAISWSDYQRLMAIQGKQAEPLQADEVLMLSNIREMEVVLAQQVTQQKRVEISEQTYRMKAYAMETIENENYGRNLVTFVVPDEAVIDLRPQRSIINVFFKKENEVILNQEFQDLALEMQMNPNRFENEIGYFQAISQSEVYQETSGQTTLLIYVGIYVGLVSLLASATILAIQQLMAVAVNREQYVILSHLGVGWEAQRKLIRQQVSFYFLMPLAVAGIHSMITIVLVIRNVAEMNFASVLHPLIITAIVFGFVYGGYGYATYSSYCQIVNEKK
ncbi:MAG: hypothetical protein ACRCZC_06390, partial [Culicoidibacterales bacterium]